MDDAVRLLVDKISGDIVFSSHPGKTIKKWRNVFQVSQKELSEKLGVSPSVISDYESDRRKSPGIAFIRKLIEALLSIDRERGYTTLSKYRNLLYGFNLDVILDILEYERPVPFQDFVEKINGTPVNQFRRDVNGHTVIDSLDAILKLNSYDFYKLYGFTSERAMIFTKVSSGRSPLVAVRVAAFKPALIVLHGLKPEDVDDIAIKISEVERIPLIVSETPIDEIIRNLRRFVQ
ncbi:MAG: helix-turn-helix domain-containing protein [Archaeoglobus sp.]|nr:helix-turn-helix domain-containing protein [Archaeoglobus sp.]